METNSIILLNNSRLVRDMIRRVINKTPGLEIVAEVDDISDYSHIARQTDADWTIFLFDPDNKFPSDIRQVLSHHTSMRLLAIAIDGSQVKMQWNEFHEISLNDKNLEELLLILKEDIHNRSKEGIIRENNYQRNAE